MLLKITVSADRDQLIGPEMILRLIHHKPYENKLNTFFNQNNKSVIEGILEMYFSRLPGPLFSNDKEVKELFSVSIIFALMNLEKDEILYFKNKYSNKYFDEFSFHNDILKYEHIKKYITTPSISFEDSLNSLLSSKNLSPDPLFKKLAFSKFTNLSESQKIKLTKSFVWLKDYQTFNDQNDKEQLINFNKNENDEWLKYLTNEIIINY